MEAILGGAAAALVSGFLGYLTARLTFKNQTRDLSLREEEMEQKSEAWQVDNLWKEVAYLREELGKVRVELREVHDELEKCHSERAALLARFTG